MDKEPTSREILSAINAFSTNVNERFEKIDERFEKIDERFEKAEGKMTTLVTKDYLDEKMADLRGDLVVLMRKEDTKLLKLVDILKNRKVISESEEKQILSLEPFSKLFV